MVSFIGYGLSAVGCAILFLLLLTVRRGGAPKFVLAMTALVMAVSSAIQALFSLELLGTVLYAVLESARYLAWLAFLTFCILGIQHKEPRSAFYKVIQICFPPILIIASQFLLSDRANYAFYMLSTLISLEVLVLLEAIYRQSNTKRWAYKPLIIYLSVTALFDFVLYANALMVQEVHPTLWLARGYVNFTLLPFIVLSVKRVKDWNIDIYVSREVVMHSSILLVAGAYLCLMALVGYGINYWGGEWNSVVLVIIASLSAVIVLTLFLSEKVRSNIRVFITKHFFANQYDYREEWLKLTDQLTSSGDELSFYDASLRAASNAINYDRGWLVKLQENKQFKTVALLGGAALNDNDLNVLQNLRDYIETGHWIIDLDELLSEPHKYPNLHVEPQMYKQCSFQFIIPVVSNGKLWGLIALVNTSDQNVALNWELRDYLSVVSNQVGQYIFQNEGALELAENAQFSAFNRMSAFVVHDLKNILAQVGLILKNAEQHKGNPEFIEDTFETLEHTQARMQKMLRQLTEKESKEADTTTINLKALIEKLIDTKCANQTPVPVLSAAPEINLSIDADKLSSVLYHLIDNAQQATPAQGHVEVLVSVEADDSICIKISDTGCGMSQEFIHTRLFKPFDTTKGNAGMGIGAYDAKMFIERIGGQLLVDSEVDKGTTFTFILPNNTK
jgi:putative PEP-CTERM system histidine kinase